MKHLAVCCSLLFALCGAEDSLDAHESNLDNAELRGGRRRETVNVVAEQVPYHVTIFRDDTNNYLFLCSGSLISRNHVLTSKQCIDSEVMEDLHIAVGISGLPTAIPESTLLVSRVVKRDREDLAILLLSDANLGNNVTVIKMASSTRGKGSRAESWSGRRRATLSGYGVARGGLAADGGDLMVSRHDVMLFAKCRLWSRRNFRFVIGKNHLCTRWENYNRCIADLGSPLVARAEDGSLLQIGVASYNLGSCSRQPIIFTSVASNYDWIETEISNTV